jgi:hypothetical protein
LFLSGDSAHPLEAAASALFSIGDQVYTCINICQKMYLNVVFFDGLGCMFKNEAAILRYPIPLAKNIVLILLGLSKVLRKKRKGLY